MRTRDRATTATLVLVGIAAVAAVGAHLLNPGLDPGWVPISEYALGPNGFAMNVMFVALALAAFALAMGLRDASGGWRLTMATIFVALGGGGFLLAALFPTDSVFDTRGVPTTSGIAHSAGAVLADFLALAAIFYAWGLPRAPEWRHRKRQLWLLALLPIAGILVVGVSMAMWMPPTGKLGPDVPVGWPNRFMILTFSAWLVAMAAIARRVRAERSDG